jgi:hypothetical protein
VLAKLSQEGGQAKPRSGGEGILKERVQTLRLMARPRGFLEAAAGKKAGCAGRPDGLEERLKGAPLGQGGAHLGLRLFEKP